MIHSNGFQLAVVLIFLACCFHQGFSIKCWVCSSQNDPKCGDPFDNSSFPITDCTGLSHEHLPGVRPTMCRKIRQKLHGQWRYFRNCAFLGEPGIGGDERYCLMRSGSYNIFMEYCSCNTKDGCNSAPDNYGISIAFMFILSTLTGYLIIN